MFTKFQGMIHTLFMAGVFWNPRSNLNASVYLSGRFNSLFWGVQAAFERLGFVDIVQTMNGCKTLGCNHWRSAKNNMRDDIDA